MNSDPDVSIVIPTRNRARLLDGMLDSLERQTLERTRFEVIVVDDGSTDGTPGECFERARRGSIRYFPIASGGIAQAKNVGLVVSRAPVVLFLDDDDVAESALVERHAMRHAERSDPGLVILGFTTWHRQIDVTSVMRYITDVGNLLFAYSNFDDGQTLPYHCFWGGRSSCKRDFLLTHGIFDPGFTTIMEDVELAYRLRPAGLDVRFDRSAVSYMVRPITYLEFCERCERRGRALARFFELHPGAEPSDFPTIREAAARWGDAAVSLSEQMNEVHELEGAPSAGRSLDRTNERLHELYAATFEAFELKGVAMAQREVARSSLSRAAKAGAVPP